MTFKWKILRFYSKEIIGEVSRIEEGREFLLGLNGNEKNKRYGLIREPIYGGGYENNTRI